MKTALNITQLAQTLSHQLTSKLDYVENSKNLTAGHSGGAPALYVREAGALPITNNAHAQLAEHIGVPKAYYDRMIKDAPNLWAESVNTWLQKKDGERRMVRTLNGAVRAILSDSYARIDNWDVVNAILPAMLAAGLEIRSCEVTENHVYMKATSPRIVKPVPGSSRVGDLVEAGIMVRNSEVGLGALQLAPFYNFLVCTNGMVRTDLSWRKAHLGRKLDSEIEGLLSDKTRMLEDRAVLSKAEDLVKAALDESRFEKDLIKMGKLNEPMVVPEESVRILADAHQLTAAEGDSILDHLLRGGNLSAWGLVNAVTRSAEDNVNYDRATELEALGGKLIDLPVESWAKVIH